jgi:DNA-directed RNA polymerase subunit RPC12/RpoP
MIPQKVTKIRKNGLERCSKCHSRLFYIRKKTNEKVCRYCGFVEYMKGENNDKI